MTMSGDASALDPDEAAKREFARARKGYDPTEVRVHLTRLADEIRRLRAVEADLREQLAVSLETPESIVDLDPAAISRALGAETVRIIDTAREASEEIRAKAEENAGRVVRDAHERANRLTRDAAELREQAGTEADELRSSSREEADRIVAEARELADSTLQAAEADAASLREEAALVLEEKTTAAELEAARIREEAEAVRTDADDYAATLRSEADAAREQVAEQAKVDAEAEVEAARERGRGMINEAKEARERMIRDLAERRHTSRQQLEALRAARESLIEAFGAARDALEDATEDLVDSLPAAREAADAAARSVSEDLDLATAELDELIDRGATTAELIDGRAETPESRVEPAALTLPLDEVAAGEVENDDEIEAEDATEDIVISESDLSGDDEVDEVEVDEVDEVEVEVDEVEVEVDEVDEVEDDEVEDDEDLIAEGLSALPEVAEPEVADPEPAGKGRLRLVSSNDGDPTPIGIEALVDPDEPEAAPVAPQRVAEVEELFARLRADQSVDDEFDDDDDFDDDLDDMTSEIDDGPGAVVIDLSASAGDSADDDPGSAIDESTDLDDSQAATQQAMLDQRDALLGDAASGLTRRIRRVVSDQENEILDLVRRNRRLKSSDDLVPSRADQLDAYRSAIRADLREVLEAGSAFLGNAGRLDEADVTRELDEVMASVADWAIDPLRKKLARVVDANEDTSPDRSELVDRLRATYREWRNDRIAELSGDVATLAFSRGVMAAAEPGQKLCWVVDHGGLPCPDGEDNQLAGPVTVGDEFPTGDLCPPAHPGCRCLLVPASR